MKTEGETVNSDQSLKPRRPKSREVSSRYLSPTSEIGIPSPTHTFSPLRQKPRSSTSLRAGLWPSSTPPPPPPQPLGTLADQLGNPRLKDLFTLENKTNNNNNNNQNTENSIFLNRQKSCTEFSRFEKTEQNRKISKDNHKTFFGGSMRYTGKLRFPGRFSNSSDQSPALADDLVPGRFSVDENALRRRSLGSDTQDSESDCSDVGSSFGSSNAGKNSPASYMLPTVSSQISSKLRRGGSQSNIQSSPENSPKKFTLKSAMKRANSVSGSERSKWAMSPPMTMEKNKGKTTSFSSLKPPTSPSRGKGGVGGLINMGLDLFRGKKCSSSGVAASSPLGPGLGESVHQLRLGHNRLVQWRYVNARADGVNRNITNQAKSSLICASSSVAKLQHSVLQKKIQFEKQKLEMKLNFILHSQIKSLEGWGDMERQHLSDVSMTKHCLHSVICRVPLVEGAQMETHSASIALRHSSDLATSIKSMLYTFSPTVQKTVSMLSELAEVVAQEKALLEEFSELFRIISTLEIQERSLKCSIVQMKLQQQQQQQQQQEEIAA